MANISRCNLLLSIVLSVMMVAANQNDEAAVEVSSNVLDRGTRQSCARTNDHCSIVYPCCSSRDVCLTTESRDSTNLRISTCVVWDTSNVIYPTLGDGETCTNSWNCRSRCCREYRPARRSPILVCGTPNEGPHYYFCVTGRP